MGVVCLSSIHGGGDPVWADVAKLVFLPRKREEFVLQAEEAGGVLQGLAILAVEMVSPALSFPSLLDCRAHLLPWSGHLRLSQRTERLCTANSGTNHTCSSQKGLDGM